MPIKLSRPVVAAMWALGVPLVHAVLPWWLSTLGERHGPNLVGFAPIAAGAVGLVWASALHVRDVPGEITVGWHAPYFIERGPYAFSRNPMYVSEIALWIGWATLFGSIVVAIGLAVLWLGIALVVRAEERMLAAERGADYARYRDRVPRWLGRRATE